MPQAQQIPNNNQIVQQLYEQGDVCEIFATRLPEAISVDMTDHGESRDSIGIVGVMCLNSQHDKLYYLDDGDYCYYFTADNDHHALVRLGIE